MNKFNIKNRMNFTISICIFLFFAGYTLIQYQGIGFPKEYEVQYSKGVLGLKSGFKGRQIIILKSLDTDSKDEIFTCDYSAFGGGESSTCGSKDDLIPYVGRQVTVGWYEQKSIIGFSNDFKQLVTLETKDHILRSYNDSLEHVNTVKKFTYFLFLPVTFILPFFYYVWFNKVDESDYSNY